MSKHRVFSPEFKVQCVLEILSGSKTITEVCHEHDLKYDVLARWKTHFLHNAPQLFQDPQAMADDHARIAELERMIGRLTLELEISKKASSYLQTQPKRNGRR